MSSIRRAFLFTATERYIVVSVNFLMLAILARILTPEQIGYAVIGAATLALAESFRDLGATAFIVQEPQLTRPAARTAATIMLLLSMLLALVLWLGAGTVAGFYGKALLKPYLQLTALTFLAGPVSGPLMALLRRDMAFGRIASINVASSSANAVAAMMAAWWGWGAMSFAWAAAAGASTAAVLALALCRDRWIFRPTLAAWRKTVGFGLYASGTGLVARATDYIPSLIIGRTLSFDAVGLYSRAATVVQLPDRCLLTGLLPVVLPVLAAEVRAGRDLKAAYLRGTAYITAVQWPSLLLLAFLAGPAVAILLGPQWTGIVPLVQIVAIAALVGFPNVLFYPLLVAKGAIRDAALVTLLLLPINLVIAGSASLLGLHALALSQFALAPITAGLSLWSIRRHVRFTLREQAEALGRSAVLAACACVPPLATWTVRGSLTELSPGGAIAVAVASGLAWMAGLMASRHPLRQELLATVAHLRQAASGPGFGLRHKPSRP